MQKAELFETHSNAVSIYICSHQGSRRLCYGASSTECTLIWPNTPRFFESPHRPIFTGRRERQVDYSICLSWGENLLNQWNVPPPVIVLRQILYHNLFIHLAPFEDTRRFGPPRSQGSFQILILVTSPATHIRPLPSTLQPSNMLCHV